MPQAVDEYIKTNNFRKVDAVKRDILSLYEDDFKKIDATGRLSVLFDAIPAQLNKKCIPLSDFKCFGQRMVGQNVGTHS